MSRRLDDVIARVLEREGGVADVGDGKGVTYYGQTRGWLAEFDLPVPANQMEAYENYQSWMRKTRLDALFDFGSIADVVVDFAVHSGHRTAIKSLQRAVGVEADGVIGPVTLNQLRLSESDDCLGVVVYHVLADRIALLGQLITDKPANAKFAKGWMQRVAEQVRTAV